MAPHTTLQGLFSLATASALLLSLAWPAQAQTPPDSAQVADYRGLHQAAHAGNLGRIQRLLADGPDLEGRDANGRTALHVAAFASHEPVIELLANSGANMNALDNDAYDIVTIAAVANDTDLLAAALANGASAGNITSPYRGTALIAAAHLGHHRVVAQLIAAGAPLDHVNNLGWTALIEAVVLGDGGRDHVETVAALLRAGANKSIADRNGVTPLQLARDRGFTAMVRLLQ